MRGGAAGAAGEESCLAVGLMSGTSCDGIDAALVRLRGSGPSLRAELVHFLTVPWPDGLRARIMALFQEDATVTQLCQLNVQAGEQFGAAALQLLEAAQVQAADVSFIGSHGQTVRHLPAAHPDQGMGSTLQIGEPSVIAAVTGIRTVADFRPADMAVGGQGAPLLPWVDFLLYQHAERGRVLLNIGGIANVTVLPPGGAAHNVVAFDTGPGNMCMDLAVSRFTQGASRMDGGGARAGAGTVNRALLQQLKQHPYFARGPPKSTGHEDFGAAFVDKLLAEAAEAGVVEDDVLATLAMLTAETVAEAVQQHCAPRCGPGGVAELWVAGGGVHNATVMQFIRDKLATVKVDTFEGLNADSDAREAIAFAILAHERLAGNANTLPAVTGARRPACGGKVCLPPPPAPSSEE